MPEKLYPPTFIGIGAQRSGTTSLYHYLVQHPQILMPRKKEIHFFDQPTWPWFPTYERYHKHFYSEREGIRASGEVTPAYCFYPGALGRIRRYNRRLKLIMILRNPIDRAISQYSIETHRGSETLPMAQAFDPAVERQRTQRDDAGLRDFSYLRRGRYGEQLENVYRLFPKEQVLVLRFDEFSKETAAAMRLITDFIGVDPLTGVEYKEYNQVKVDYEPPEAKLRVALAGYFAPHNALLTARYGIRTDDWT